ncbi:regulator [Staphylococcus sp. HMSC057A08]|uniref:regulator n=1 Tax=Staphylococcus sp. HMSC057A08 TaxID=1739385 RepID=UPI00114CC3CB|nr:regulator [Staphylococcus sp. HMSC057A08]
MMFKRILINLIFAELLYLLIKPLIIKLESEDDIDTAPKDFANEWDQIDLNKIRVEVSE